MTNATAELQFWRDKLAAIETELRADPDNSSLMMWCQNVRHRVAELERKAAEEPQTQPMRQVWGKR